MNCQEAKDRVFEYQDGDLSGPEQEALERHLGACDECRSWFARRETIGCRLVQQLHESTQLMTLSPETRSRVLAALANRETGAGAAAKSTRQSAAGESAGAPRWGLRQSLQLMPSLRRWLVPLAAAAGLLALGLVVSRLLHAGLPTVSANVPHVVTTYVFRKEGNYVVDALADRSQLVWQTFQADRISGTFENSSR